jgi:hypothetical protein
MSKTDLLGLGEQVVFDTKSLEGSSNALLGHPQASLQSHRFPPQWAVTKATIGCTLAAVDMVNACQAAQKTSQLRAV